MIALSSSGVVLTRFVLDVDKELTKEVVAILLRLMESFLVWRHA
jgi:hypothetical protein